MKRIVILIAIVCVVFATAMAQDTRCHVDSCNHPTFGYAESPYNGEEALELACYQARANCEGSSGVVDSPCIQTNHGTTFWYVWTGAKVCCRFCDIKAVAQFITRSWEVRK